MARLLSAHGAPLVLAARRLDKVEALATSIRAEGGKALAVALDVVDEAATIAAFDAAEATFGTVDTVVANAGIAVGGRSTELPVESILSVIETNLVGVFLTAREGAKRMIAAGTSEASPGRIILIGSITAQMTGQGDAAYAASKAAVAHLGRQFAREWVRRGINVNTIQPGYIRTDINGDWFDTPGGLAQIASWHRRRLMPAQALDGALLFLCSDAARHMTGATITVDDGQSL